MIKHFAHIQHNQISFFRPHNLTTTDTNLQNINFTIRTAIRSNNTISNTNIDLTHPELLKAHIEKDLIPFISKCNHDSTSPRLSIAFGGFFCKGNDKHLPHTLFTNKHPAQDDNAVVIQDSSDTLAVLKLHSKHTQSISLPDDDRQVNQPKMHSYWK